MTTKHLYEEDITLKPLPDEDIELHMAEDEEYDWGCDPMAVLEAKQERERAELEAGFTRH